MFVKDGDVLGTVWINRCLTHLIKHWTGCICQGWGCTWNGVDQPVCNSPHQTLWTGHVCPGWGCTWSGGGPVWEPGHPEWSVCWPPTHAFSATAWRMTRTTWNTNHRPVTLRRTDREQKHITTHYDKSQKKNEQASHLASRFTLVSC